MNKLAISESDLLEKYNRHVDFLIDECDWITHFNADAICNIVYGILMSNKVRVKISQDELFRLYSEYVDSLDIKREEWLDKYGIPEIIHIIYCILEENC